MPRHLRVEFPGTIYHVHFLLETPGPNQLSVIEETLDRQISETKTHEAVNC